MVNDDVSERKHAEMRYQGSNNFFGDDLLGVYHFLVQSPLLNVLLLFFGLFALYRV